MTRRSRRQWVGIGIVLLVFASVKAILVKWYIEHQDETKLTALLCSPSSPCELPGGGVLRFVTVPRSDRPFELVLTGVGAQVPEVQFSMEHMNMGMNRYHFVRHGNRWLANITLPYCVSGSRDWVMRLTVDNRHYTLPFNTR